jgi:hypothetical protein
VLFDKLKLFSVIVNHKLIFSFIFPEKSGCELGIGSTGLIVGLLIFSFKDFNES